MSEMRRALFQGYGVSEGKMKTQAQRRHESMCSDGRYCENRDCPPGKAWRAAHNYKVQEIDGAKEAVPSGDVREGRPEMLAQGTADGKQEPPERDRAVRLPVLPQADRTGTAETNAPDGSDTRLSTAAKADAKARGTTADRIARLRERLRSGSEPGGQTDREATPSTESSTVLQTLRAENPDRMGSRDGQAMAKTQPKRGRPRKYVTAEELKRANRDRVQKHRRKARGNV